MSEQERLDAFERGGPTHSTIEEAVDSYLDHRMNESELMESTVEVEKRRLRYLVDYCEQQGIETPRELLSHDLDKYRTWRRSEAPLKVEELAESTIVEHMKTVDRFVDYVEAEDE
ncbi:hypothetical protein ACFQDG_00520 [Natronoarchaeum mannanilyticum]|uniref:Core-binding (CB) domain-containing protein n=1 Tax=Natronoarchaeum mannanilyticum TaxID=926360 RepID=A0AAV3TDH2_9EURY